MQTFVPYRDFRQSALALDTKRLGKQRVECIQIIRALTVPGYGWANHPAVLMWKGYEEALGRYSLTMCEVWLEKGFGDTCAATIAQDLRTVGIEHIRSEAELREAGDLPPWLENDALLRSHQSALVRKEPDLYRPVFGDEIPDDIPYLWPVRSEKAIEAEAKKAANVLLRAERAAARALADAEKAARKRSRAAKKAAATRKKNRKAAAASQ